MAGAAALCLAAPARAAASPDSIIENVTVLPMTGAAPIANASVVITGGRIAAILINTSSPRPRGHTRIDARGQYLMPGLTDAHAHLEADDLVTYFFAAMKVDMKAEPVRTQDAVLPYLANGVLQIFNLAATPDGFRQKREIASGTVLGPRIVSAAMIDGAPNWPVGMTRIAKTPAEGRAAVRQAAADGYQMIKPYSALDLESFTAIVDEARKLNLPVAGHIPAREKGITEKFFQPGFGMVAHAEEFAQHTKLPDIAAIPRYVEMAKASGTGLIATLSLDERLLEQVRDPASLKARSELAYLHPSARRVALNHNPYVARRSPGFIAALERIIAFNRVLVKAFADAGISILTGTDSGVPGMAPGFSLHDELAALVAAGLSNEQALVAATAAPGAWLKNQTGTVSVGQHADLLLLDADPLSDIANTRKINAIVIGGRYVTKAELDRRMAKLAAKAK